jgi:hypothetical protein
MSPTPGKSSKVAVGPLTLQSIATHSISSSEVFKGKDPHRIALSLKRSAERSKRRKGTPCQSAMSMLNFYINRAGKNLPKRQKQILERAKGELRVAFGRS